MASTFEKSVKGATKIKLAAPKAKYVEHILIATHSGEAAMAEVFRALSTRLRDGTWTVVFKALIVTHMLIREGARDATLTYLSNSPRILTISTITAVNEQGQNIQAYAKYLRERVVVYADVKVDYVRQKYDKAGAGKLRTLSIEKGLLRHVEGVQKQIGCLLKCRFFHGDVDNEISLTAFRLLVADLLALFQAINEGVINVLEHYFEMSRYDAERALEIYKVFVDQTEGVVEYLSIARSLEGSTRLQIPNIKHAPTSLLASLQDYLKDPNFEQNRAQYLIDQEKKRTGKSSSKDNTTFKAPATTSPTQATTNPYNASTTTSQPAQKGAVDMVDFFASIESEQQTMFPNQTGAVPPLSNQLAYAPPQQPYSTEFDYQGAGGYAQPQQIGVQATGYQPQSPVQQQSYYPYQQQQQQPPVQPQQVGVQPTGYIPYTQPQSPPSNGYGLGTIPESNPFGAVTQSPPPVQPQFQVPQQQFSPVQPQMTGSSNPFRQSMMPPAQPSFHQQFASEPGAAVMAPQATGHTRTSTNPFSAPQRSSTLPPQSTTSPVQPPRTFSPPMQSSATLQPQMTGSSNPFRQSMAPQMTGNPAPMQAQATGSTNPFRQSTMGTGMQGAYGQGQQGQQMQPLRPQTTAGGLENLETIPVFPRQY
ncbi:hypothetical protein YB2330_004162 [Saitoella coloradoensis]